MRFLVQPKILLLILLPLLMAMGFGDKRSLSEDANALEDFSEPKQEINFSARKGNLQLKNASIVEDVTGKCLEFLPSSWAEYDPPIGLTTAAGTISIWVKPGWREGDSNSHTVFSSRWKDGKKGYLALSQGWWEPAGSDRLYFILSNQEHVHCSLPYKLTPGFWSNITVSWNSGPKGFCRLYIDGKKVAEKSKSFLPSSLQDGPLFLGIDKGATNSHSRGFEGCLDDLTIFDKALRDEEVANLYREQLKQPHLVENKKFKWLNDGLKLSLKQERTKDGTLIETRAIFDEDIRWAISRFETDRILARIKRARFNVYVPCVWHGKGTYFPSTIVKADPRVQRRIDAGEDPLAYLIEKSHSMGIEVHPWFTVVKRGNDSYPQFFDDGSPEKAYNVHNIEFRKFIVNLMMDLVKRYDVDGVNLDYIRTMGICTSDHCRKNYEDNLGHNFWADYALKHVSGPARDRLQRWQDTAVTHILEDFSAQTWKIKPDLIISVDGHPRPKTKTRPLEGRDETKWANSGLIDIIFAMDYRERIDFETIDLVRKDLNNKDKLIVLFGNYEKNDQLVLARSGSLVAKYAEFAKKKWPGSGVAFYLYAWLSDEQIEALRKGAFAETSIPKWPDRLKRVSNQ
ncbi:MAG: family 10 glycosylhydrolase [Syntrophotaleaceae bacterium]